MPGPTRIPRRRCRPLRRESDEHPWFVTTRVLEERFLLHPILTCGAKPINRKARMACKHMERHCDKRLGAVVAVANRHRKPGSPKFTLEHVKLLAQHLVTSALARAQERYGTKVYSLVVMSNHLHLVCHTEGKNLAAFMGYFKARITDAINLLTCRKGPLWARRYDAEPILDDHGVTDRMGYTLNNPAAANLVEDPELWPGLNLAYGMGDTDTIQCIYFDATAWHHKKRPLDVSPFFKTATLTLSPIPSCLGLSREDYYQSLRSWIAAAQQKGLAKRADDRGEAPRSPPLGVDKALLADFNQRPRNPAFKRRPYAFGTPQNVRDHNHAMLRTIAEYSDKAEHFRNGQWDVDFPEGTYRPPLMQAA